MFWYKHITVLEDFAEFFISLNHVKAYLADFPG